MSAFRSFVQVLIISLLVSGCVIWERESGHWSLIGAAPTHYDMWLISAQLEKSGVRSWRAPLGEHMGCCWRGPRGPFGSGGKLAPFHNLIALHWFSFAEQKYYSTLIQVPSDLQERMREPARHITQRGNVRYEPRSTLVLGLAPGGEVVL